MTESRNNNNQSLVNQKETETVKVRYSEIKTETRNEYDITKLDGTNVKGVKTTTNNYRILECEGKIDQILKKIDNLGKTLITIHSEQKMLGESSEAKLPKIIQEPQINQETFPQVEEKVEVLKTVDVNLVNDDNNSGSEN